MKYTVYKITNNINGKIYKGAHKTSDLNDGYMGSGKILLRAIEKYGVENFTKEILHVFDNSEEMYNKERELVNEQFIKRSDVYNLKLGGSGGFDHVNSIMSNGERVRRSKLGAAEMKRKLSTCDQLRSQYSARIRTTLHNDEVRTKARNTIKTRYPDGIWFGRKHKAESKELIGKANSIHQSGSGNSQYGSKWIHNLELRESRKISNDCEIPVGWSTGRVINWDFLDRKCSSCDKHLQLKSRNNTKICNSCKPKRISPNIKNKSIKQTTEEKYVKLWEEFILGDYNSISEFSRYKNISVQGLAIMWKKHINTFSKNIEHGKSLSSSIARNW